MTISRLKNDPYRGRAILFAALLACFLGFASLGSAETDLTVPAGTLVIEDEAFMGDTSLTRVAAGEGLLRIESRAFAGCGLKEAQLPASVEYIAPDTFTGNGGLVISAPKGSYALRWAEDHGILFQEISMPASYFGYSELDDGTIRIDEYIGPAGGVDVVIPRYIDGKPVTEIGGSAFYDKAGLSGSLTIPSGIKSIGNSAFSGCAGFTGDLIIPDGVTVIDDFAFFGCRGFNGGLTIPRGVTGIGIAAFYDCSCFTGSLNIPSGVTDIGNSAFSGCSGFTGSLSIPDSVTSIGECAFVDCSGFTGSLNIPAGVTIIAAGSFTNCGGFNGTLTIPDSVNDIGEWAFAGCSGFTGDLTIPGGVTGIGDYAFFNCSGFTGGLDIPGGVAVIGDCAFRYCGGFTGSLVIPGSVTGIGSFAFDGCTGLEKTVVPVTGPDGTVIMAERIAVYCPRGSYAWSWAENDDDLEPLEWDGVSRPGSPS